MGNGTKIGLVLVLVLVVVVIANVLDRDIGRTPSGRDQTVSGPPSPQGKQVAQRDEASPDPGTWPPPETSTTSDSTSPALPSTTPGGEAEKGAANPAAPGKTDAGGFAMDSGAGTVPSSSTDSASTGNGYTLDGGTLSPNVLPPSNAELGGGSSSLTPGIQSSKETPGEGTTANSDLAASGKTRTTTTTENPPAKKAPTGATRKHIVVDGDRLWDLAEEYYGKGALFSLIVKANPQIGDGEMLRVGMELEIPPVPQEKPRKEKELAKKAGTGHPGFTAHKVEDGDTLYGLASSYLGSGERWSEIAKANPGIDPDHLRVGTEVLIPQKSAGRAPKSTAQK